MEKKNIIEEIRKFVEEECKKPTSKYGYEPYKYHFIPVVNYAVELAKKLNADIEVVELAALLHDIGAIIEGRGNHHITGAEVAEKKLKELGCPIEKVKKIKNCILSHRGSKSLKPDSIEAQIIIDADAMSNFDNLPGIFKAAFIYENQTQGQAKETTRQKLMNTFNKIIFEESRDLIKPKYDAAMLLLN